jgi:cohesin loading factor subunit SCC2
VFKVSSLSDKTNNSTDNNAAKTVALDHLGVIAARLTTSSLKFRNVPDRETVKSLEEVVFLFFPFLIFQ